jgi:hypothetical protein
VAHLRMKLATAAGLAALAVAFAQPVSAQDAVGGRPAALPLAGHGDGARIERVSVWLRQGGGSEARDQAIVGRVAAALARFEGRTLNRIVFETRLAALRTRMGTGGLTYELRDTTAGTELLVEVDTTEDGERDQIGALRGRPGDLPVLLRTESAFLTALVSGGVGVYSDRQPWFGADATFLRGSPIAGVLPGTEATWTEGFIEYGLGGAVQIGDLRDAERVLASEKLFAIDGNRPNRLFTALAMPSRRDPSLTEVPNNEGRASGQPHIAKNDQNENRSLRNDAPWQNEHENLPKQEVR